MKVRQNILITGASSGLGAGLAREFAARGRNLALCARRGPRLLALRDELLAAHPGIQVSVRELDVDDHARVFEVFRAFAAEFGRLDRVIVNAGIARGGPVGSGVFEANRDTARTNFVSALAQCEAAVEIFRAQQGGHLVTVASMSAMRGMPGGMTVYGASKAALAALTEGIRHDLHGSAIRVTTLFPGFIRSDMTRRIPNAPFMIDTASGCRALARAIEREPAEACIPAWPWWPLRYLLKLLPAAVMARLR